MIDYNKIKETLRAVIWNDLGCFFVDLENGDPRPDNQDDIDTFISHKFTSPYIPQKGYEANNADDLNYVTHPTMTLSLTVYSSSKGDALNKAHQLKQWFAFHGYEYLKENELIIVSTSAIQDRTTFLETRYDNRVGFDATIRVVDQEVREIDLISKVDLNKEQIGE
ncbi:hypothetical protein G4V62_13810 [Bacillaceae bacterium SIJ1]|uniref:phage neck terminator protein n=1 Tax=Litoribacterium kuwaitense TaxID=1398745 RepID=UPI0013ED4EE4|nr:hypothetical protein [Litoribacterium kuwaitense]NGP45970.1 hypothetical protein [Litoribacterium kuwaitense]